MLLVLDNPDALTYNMDNKENVNWNDSFQNFQEGKYCWIYDVK